MKTLFAAAVISKEGRPGTILSADLHAAEQDEAPQKPAVAPMRLIDVEAIGSGTEPSAYERVPRLHPGAGAAVTRVEPEDLARFEGEGGLEAPEPAAVHP